MIRVVLALELVQTAAALSVVAAMARIAFRLRRTLDQGAQGGDAEQG